MPPKKRFISCEICRYRSSRKDREKRMFMAKFPLDEDRCKQWVEVVGKEDLVYVPIEKLHTLKYVCGSHFKDSDFNRKKSRLKKTAVPSRNLNAVPLSDELLNEFPYHITSKSSNVAVTEDFVPKRMCAIPLLPVKSVAGPSGSGHSQSLPEVSSVPDELIASLTADDSQSDHEEDTLPKSEVPLPNSDMPLQKSDVDGSAVFSWQTEHFVKDVEVLDGDWPDETETSLYQDQDEARVDKSALPDEEYTYRCNSCRENITGFRYTCVQCSDWDLCGACEARAAHAAHYVLRVPSPRPYKETLAVLAAIRRQLLHENVFVQDESDSLKEEVKDESVVSLDPQSEDDPLDSGEHMQEEYLEEMSSESESIADHELPRKRPRLYSQSDQSVTSDFNDTTKSDDDMERPDDEPNAVCDRLHNTTEGTSRDQTTREITRSLIKRQHSDLQGTTLTPHQKQKDSSINTHRTDSNTLHKRREVKVAPDN